jgi:hypothetical protein
MPNRIFYPRVLKRIALLCVCGLFLSTTASAAEKLVYSVTTGQEGRWPRIEKTEIFAVDPQGGQPRVVFSDAGADFLLVTSGERLTAAAGKRVFALGVDRKNYQNGFPHFPAAVYELSTDGSNHARKIFDIEGENGSTNFRDLFASPSGSKIGHINNLGGKWTIILHDTATGKLLLKMDLTPIALDCFVRDIGWMPDGNRLFFTLETGDVDMTSKASYARAASYLMPDTGGVPVRVASDLTAHPRRPGYQPVADTPPTLLGQLPDGRYLLSEFQWRQGPAVRAPAKATTFLYAVSSATGTRKDFLTNANVLLGSFHFSASGRLVSYVESHGEQRVGRDLIDNRTVHVLDLTTGKDLNLFSFPAKLLNLPVTELIGWLDEK